MGIKVAASSAVSAINFGFDLGFCKVEAQISLSLSKVQNDQYMTRRLGWITSLNVYTSPHHLWQSI